MCRVGGSQRRPPFSPGPGQAGRDRSGACLNEPQCVEQRTPRSMFFECQRSPPHDIGWRSCIGLMELARRGHTARRSVSESLWNTAGNSRRAHRAPRSAEQQLQSDSQAVEKPQACAQEEGNSLGTFHSFLQASEAAIGGADGAMSSCGLQQSSAIRCLLWKLRVCNSVTCSVEAPSRCRYECARIWEWDQSPS